SRAVGADGGKQPNTEFAGIVNHPECFDRPIGCWQTRKIKAGKAKGTRRSGATLQEPFDRSPTPSLRELPTPYAFFFSFAH
ncbi:MAG: hypothetical protein SFY68_11135, partial [Candidatus Sumerlaeia bacterium]|nr:hypothetical protein [Candidatus Sumerlaeia bacterium]